jgi:hypothetical protein
VHSSGDVTFGIILSLLVEFEAKKTQAVINYALPKTREQA